MAQLKQTYPHTNSYSTQQSIIPSMSLRSWAIRLLGLLTIIMGLGSVWDVKWHYAIGRDSFWIPPHLLMYASVAFSGLLCVGVILYETWRSRSLPSSADISIHSHRLFWFRGPLGLFVSGGGVLMMLLAAPFDDLWHRLYGIDVTIWSPPHMLGVLGGTVIALGGVIAAAQQRQTVSSRDEYLVVILFLMSLLAAGCFALIPAMRLSFWPYVYTPSVEPVGPSLLLYPSLASLLLVYPLTAAARFFDGHRAWLAPLAVLVAFVLLNVLHTLVGRIGFTLALPWGDQHFMRPIFGVERALWTHPLMLSLPTFVLAITLFASRHWHFSYGFWLAGALFGLAMMIQGITLVIVSNPALIPDLGEVLVGLIVAPLLGLASGIAGSRLGRWLSPADRKEQRQRPL